MTSKPVDRAGAELNRYWREQQKQQQKPTDKPVPVIPAAENLPVIQPDIPLVAKPESKAEEPQQNQTPNQGGPAECEGCAIKSGCKQIMKMWHSHAPRPDLVRAWVQLVDKNAGQMVCLSKMMVHQ